MKYTIDRFEGDFAVVELEDKTMANIPKAALPSDAQEGSVINVSVDTDETQKRVDQIENLMDDLFN